MTVFRRKKLSKWTQVTCVTKKQTPSNPLKDFSDNHNDQMSTCDPSSLFLIQLIKIKKYSTPHDMNKKKQRIKRNNEFKKKKT